MSGRNTSKSAWRAARQAFRWCLFAACFSLRFGPGACAAQAVASPVAESAGGVLAEALTPEQRSMLLDPAPGGDAYRLGRGDLLTITVSGRPELTGKQPVGPDGAVTLPLIGSVEVVDRTREQAAGLLREKLLQYYTDPAVTVTVDTYTSNRVLLLGAVERPGPYVFERQPTLLDLLARGGSISRVQTGSTPNFTGVTGQGIRALPERAVIYRGADTAITIDVGAMAKQGSLLANIRLQRDDVVYVTSPEDRFISILGQVQRPGAQPLEHETTLARLLSNAGGLTKEAGTNPMLRIVEPSTGKTRLVAFKDVLNPASTEIPLRSGDILFVPQSRFNSAAYVLDRLSPVFNLFTTAAFITQR